MSPLKIFLRFLRRLPDYYLATKALYVRDELQLPVNVCVFDRKNFIYTPDDLLVNTLWVHHCTSYYIRGEIREWLKFTKNCQALLDVGASAGIFSAIFWKSSKPGVKIYSVEPDAHSFELLRETIRLNCGSGADWKAVNCALSDKVGELRFYSSGFGGDLGGANSTKAALYHHPDDETAASTAPMVVAVKTLESLCRESGFMPDVIKMDIESYEFEALTASLAFLNELRPRLFLELHNEKMRGRGFDPHHLLEQLLGIGYSLEGVGNLRRVCAPPIVHLCLTPSPIR